jgi:uncharacterized protein YkwD
VKRVSNNANPVRLQRFLHLRRGESRAGKHTRAVAGKLLHACACASLLALLGTGAAASASAATPPCAGAHVTPNAGNAALVDSATLCLMNELRVAHGLRALHVNGTLASIATGQAGDMVRGDYFGDDSLSGASPLSRIKASGYSLPASHVRLLTAQNIGWGTGPNATPAGIVKAWMLSPPHRQIILTAAYRDVGVGVAPTVPSQLRSRWLGATYAVEFGARER